MSNLTESKKAAESKIAAKSKIADLKEFKDGIINSNDTFTSPLRKKTSINDDATFDKFCQLLSESVENFITEFENSIRDLNGVDDLHMEYLEKTHALIYSKTEYQTSFQKAIMDYCDYAEKQANSAVNKQRIGMAMMVVGVALIFGVVAIAIIVPPILPLVVSLIAGAFVASCFLGVSASLIEYFKNAQKIPNSMLNVGKGLHQDKFFSRTFAEIPNLIQQKNLLESKHSDFSTSDLTITKRVQQRKNRDTPGSSHHTVSFSLNGSFK